MLQCKWHDTTQMLVFSYDNFTTEEFNTLKRIPGSRHWTATTLNRPGYRILRGWQYFMVPINLTNYQCLKHISSFDNLILFALKQPLNPPTPLPEIPLPSKLFEYQKRAVRFLHQRKGSALLGDDPGLGKSCEALTYLRVHPRKRPALVVCPSTIKYNWEREVKLWAPECSSVVLSSKSPHKLIPTIPNFNQYDIYIINYDVLWYWVKALSQIPFKIVIYDESHYLKNYKSRRTGAAYQLAWIKSKLFMSGTLATNRPEELFVPLNLLEPREFYNWTYYANRYCGANSYNGWLTRGATHVNELHHRIQPLLLRRKKEDVLKDLPPKLYSVVPIEIENRAEYRKAELQFVDWLVNRHGASKARSAMIAEALTKLTYLKSLVAEGVLKPTIQWISDFLTSTERKLVVFGIHTTLVTGIYEHFRDIAVMIDGSISTEKRMPIVDQFQNNPKVRLFVGNIQAAGVGITLTAASDVMVCEFPWTPGVLDQCLDRLHRIGQKNQVMVYYLAARQTIEEKVVSALSEKRKVLAKLLDGKPVEKQQQNVIDYLISQYEK